MPRSEQWSFLNKSPGKEPLGRGPSITSVASTGSTPRCLEAIPNGEPRGGPEMLVGRGLEVVPGGGIEPSTHGFSIRYLVDQAIHRQKGSGFFWPPEEVKCGTAGLSFFPSSARGVCGGRAIDMSARSKTAARISCGLRRYIAR